MADFYLGEGDLDPILKATLELPDGTLPNLIGATLAFYMAPIGSALPATGQSVSIVGDPTLANVQYAWIASDSLVPGSYYFHIRGTLSDGRQITFPSHGYKTLEVQPKL